MDAVSNPGEASGLHRDQSHDILQQILSEDDDGAAFLQSLGVKNDQLERMIPTSITQAAVRLLLLEFSFALFLSLFISRSSPFAYLV